LLRAILELKTPIAQEFLDTIFPLTEGNPFFSSWGLGESIVGGTVTPDTFIVRKSELAITSRTIADKQHMTVSTAGGTHEVEVPRFLRAQASLNDEQVIEMAKLALTLEATMEHPVDIECAYAGGELYLLQCRPITTLR